jgi:hypothetical protein
MQRPYGLPMGVRLGRRRPDSERRKSWLRDDDLKERRELPRTQCPNCRIRTADPPLHCPRYIVRGVGGEDDVEVGDGGAC